MNDKGMYLVSASDCDITERKVRIYWKLYVSQHVDVDACVHVT